MSEPAKKGLEVVKAAPPEIIPALPKTKLRALTDIKHGLGTLQPAEDLGQLRPVLEGTHRVLLLKAGAELPEGFDPVAQGLVEGVHYELSY